MFWLFSGKPSDSGAQNKSVLKTSTGMVSVIMKPIAASNSNKTGKLDDNNIQNGHSDKSLAKAEEKREDNINSSSNVLQSLCQNYDDSDDDEE